MKIFLSPSLQGLPFYSSLLWVLSYLRTIMSGYLVMFYNREPLFKTCWVPAGNKECPYLGDRSEKFPNRGVEPRSPRWERDVIAVTLIRKDIGGCNKMTWWTGLINCRFWGLRSGEHITYHYTYVQVYGYWDPVVWPWFSCVWVTLAFSQGPNSDNIPLYIHYTRSRRTERLRADLRTWSHETSTPE